MTVTLSPEAAAEVHALLKHLEWVGREIRSIRTDLAKLSEEAEGDADPEEAEDAR